MNDRQILVVVELIDRPLIDGQTYREIDKMDGHPLPILLVANNQENLTT